MFMLCHFVYHQSMYRISAPATTPSQKHSHILGLPINKGMANNKATPIQANNRVNIQTPQ